MFLEPSERAWGERPEPEPEPMDELSPFWLWELMAVGFLEVAVFCCFWMRWPFLFLTLAESLFLVAAAMWWKGYYWQSVQWLGVLTLATAGMFLLADWRDRRPFNERRLFSSIRILNPPWR